MTSKEQLEFIRCLDPKLNRYLAERVLIEEEINKLTKWYHQIQNFKETVVNTSVKDKFEKVRSVVIPYSKIVDLKTLVVELERLQTKIVVLLIRARGEYAGKNGVFTKEFFGKTHGSKKRIERKMQYIVDRAGISLSIKEQGSPEFQKLFGLTRS